MGKKDIFFNVHPKIVKANKESAITVQPLFDHCKLKNDARYFLIKRSIEQRGLNNIEDEKLELYPANGMLEFRLFFEGEQEHILDIFEVTDGKEIKYYSFSVYSLEEDLFLRKPYKGDMHIHTYYSDGAESPAYVAASCRKIGLDFIAITDHGKYEPSLEAINAFKSLNIDFKIFPGEEVHPPRNAVHMINFGGRFSINELFKDEEKYMEEVEKITRGLEAGNEKQDNEKNDNKKNLYSDLSDTDKYQYASCFWCFTKIREAGGMGIYCHPFWVYGSKYNVSAALNAFMFKTRPFDAYEILGGYDTDAVNSNNLQVAYYQEEREKGNKVPIVGVSDAHSCESGRLFGWYYTIVFSPDPELPNIIDSIKKFYSVAVEALPGESARVYGPFRLVKYALFLIKEVFPAHDAICFEEGKYMMEYIKSHVLI
ncbi:MAG: hypothetical protein HPY74_12340 [Firmicutes bacterium]|nr:hypothetical protein [Bacillota bacterium]